MVQGEKLETVASLIGQLIAAQQLLHVQLLKQCHKRDG
jgi:hypothetical protein